MNRGTDLWMDGCVNDQSEHETERVNVRAARWKLKLADLLTASSEYVSFSQKR